MSHTKFSTLTLASVLIAFALAGCGTTSGIKSAKPEAALNLTAYDRVLIKDFADSASQRAQGAKQEELREELKIAGRHFPDIIAAEVRKTRAFKEVLRDGAIAPGTIVLAGDITRYERGSRTARLIVGMGAGSSYLDATIEVRDAQTGELLGTVSVDKNSWVLGGGLAATQTPEAFMEEAARKIAAELKKSKTAPDKM